MTPDTKEHGTMNTETKTLLDRLEEIDDKIADDTANELEISEGCKLVRLANSAPAMLAALKQILSEQGDRTSDVEIALAAIAKAEGRHA